MDEQLRNLKRSVQVQPDDIELLRRYATALERVLGGESLDPLQQIASETSVQALRQMRNTLSKITTAIGEQEKAIWARIEAIQKSCEHQYGEPSYGIYIETVCKKCEKSEWY